MATTSRPLSPRSAPSQPGPKQSIERDLPEAGRIGVQNHTNDFVGVHEMGLYHLLKDYDTRYIGASWDAAHNALEGMAPKLAIDVLPGMIYEVNLKNGFWRLTTPLEAEIAE